jgi:hypothetical protein
MRSNTDFNLNDGFRSNAARGSLGVAALGFLGALGFVPGWERLFGFTGFFGFIGVAFIIELVHRVRNRQA